MIRESAGRLTLTVDRELILFLEEYAWRHHMTKSDVISLFIESLQGMQEGGAANGQN